MRTTVVIPARYGSTRFPGKPLADVAGRSLIQRVVQLAEAAQPSGGVCVATDNARIVEHVEGFGGRAVLTPESCRNGTERCAAVLDAFEASGEVQPDLIVNLQGDAVLTPPWVIAETIAAAEADADAAITTPATAMTGRSLELFLEAKAAGEVGGTTVVMDRAGYALYFSKAPIPFQRHPEAETPIYRHFGLYAYRAASLRQLVALEPGPLERVESLEQLRALENGLKVRVVVVDTRGRSHLAIDSPEDLQRVVQVIADEGELVP
ncbi:MAG: 3-deoxy-manno-octulosonate cytidylyltransferase [Planctomycetota bacterium]|jgi:3-deoxy-manno-octulosonate cytidylyltransferase (CMP-KDO synthetase)